MLQPYAPLPPGVLTLCRAVPRHDLHLLTSVVLTLVCCCCCCPAGACAVAP